MRATTSRRHMAAVSVSFLLAATCLAVATATIADTFSVVTPTRIMPLGDSLTRGSGSSWGHGYRLPLMHQMVAGRYSSDLVGAVNNGPPWLYDRHHAGYGGYGIDDITKLVAGELNTHLPDYVLLMIGSNDVQWNYNLDTAPARLSALIDHMLQTRPSVHVVVASIPPLRDSVMDAHARIYNAAIPGIVEQKAAAGKPVSFIDMYPLFTLDDLVDNVHLNDAGYEKLAAAWAARLAALRPVPPARSARACPCSIWSTNDVPSTIQLGTTPVEVGVKFRAEKDGFITAIRFYKAQGSGQHEARVWKAISDPSTYTTSSTTISGTLLATGAVTTGPADGWQEVTFAVPVPVQAHTVYFASYYSPSGRYAADPGYFRNRDIVHSPLRLPSQGSIDGNGFIRVGSPGLPDLPSPQSDTNYWVDVVFVAAQPAAPDTVTATVISTSAIDVSWGAVSQATGYKLQRSTDGAIWTAVASVTAGVTSYSNTGLASGTAYRYRVITVSNGAESAPSAVATATTQPTTLPAPASVTAMAVSSTRIDVAWSSVAGAAGYRLERSTNGTLWTTVATTGAGVTAYNDTGLQAATTYAYRVVTTSAAGDSLPSSVASATTHQDADTIAPTAPSRLKASAAKGKVNLSWAGSTDAGGSGLAGYTVWRSSTGAAGSFSALGSTAGTSFSDGAVTANTDYWYRITAFDGAGNESASSNIVSARPK